MGPQKTVAVAVNVNVNVNVNGCSRPIVVVDVVVDGDVNGFGRWFDGVYAPKTVADAVAVNVNVNGCSRRRRPYF